MHEQMNRTQRDGLIGRREPQCLPSGGAGGRPLRAGGPVLMPLLGLLGLAGCRAPGVPLPRRIVDLSPVLTADVNMQRLGSHALEFLGSDGRIRSTPVVPNDPGMAFGLHALNFLSHSGAHLDAPARILRGGDRPARAPRRQPREGMWTESLPLFQARIPVIVGLVNLEALARERKIIFAGFPLP